MRFNKRVVGAFALGLIGPVALFWVSQAGNLEPPGSPDSTMVTLQDIYDRLGGPGTGGAAVAKTGQAGCWDASGTPIACAGTGQDGEYQAGVSVDPRFTDNADGTVKDNLTGLIWLQDASCFGLSNWTTALSDASGLASGSCGLTDSSVAGDWRLSNAKELQSLIDFGQHSPALPPGHPFTGVQFGYYWSSTSYAYSRNEACSVSPGYGNVSNSSKTFARYTWPVRSGQ
jgi:hypothetical protein